jgi:YidC/Oxa1 family membrane protein insertase
VFGALLLVIIVTAEVTRRVFRPAPVEGDSPMNSVGMQRAFGVLHYLTAVFAVFVPLAAALYLTVTVVWTLVQRVLLRRRYPLPAPMGGAVTSAKSPAATTKSPAPATKPAKKGAVSPAAGSAR